MQAASACYEEKHQTENGKIGGEGTKGIEGSEEAGNEERASHRDAQACRRPGRIRRTKRYGEPRGDPAVYGAAAVVEPGTEGPVAARGATS